MKTIADLTPALKAAATKYALKAGESTTNWTDEQFVDYINEKGIRGPRKPRTQKAQPAPAPFEPSEPKVDPVQSAVAQVANPTGNVEQAIADLVAGLGLNAKAELDEARVIELINAHSLAPRVTAVDLTKAGQSEPVRITGQHFMYAEFLAYIAAGENVAAVGPAGSGKSTMFKNIAEELGLDYYTTGAVQQESKIMGFHCPTRGYVRTPFRDAYEHGGLIVLEECDGSSARAMLAANNATANDVTDFPDGMVKRHENFICVMAMNTYGTGASRQYVGRTQLDAATLDRFCFLEVPYDEAMERQAALDINAEAGNWVSTVQAFRAKVEAAGIRHVVSPRASIKGANLLKSGVSEASITKSLLHKGLSADQLKQLAA